MSTYKVMVCRTRKEFGTLLVAADTKAQAEVLALLGADSVIYEPSPATHRVMDSRWVPPQASRTLTRLLERYRKED